MRKILKRNKIKPFRVFDENGLSSLPRIILSSVVVILFFYSLPIIICFTSNKLENPVKYIGLHFSNPNLNVDFLFIIIPCEDKSFLSFKN